MSLSLSGRRIDALDGIRGVAIALVMVNHLCYFLMPGWDHTAFGRGFIKFYNNGWLGVDVFFVLSGFLITGILLEMKKRPAYWRTFYTKRFFRLGPVFVLVCGSIAAGLLLAHRMTPLEAVLYLSPFSNWQILRHNHIESFSHLWSLAIEEQFYLVWPLIVRHLRVRTVMWLALAIAFASAMTHGACTLMGVSGFEIYLATPTHLFGIAAGSAMGAAMKDDAARAFLRRAWKWIAAAATMLWITGFVMGNFQFYYMDSSTAVFAIVGTGTIVAVLIFHAVEGTMRPRLHDALSSDILRWLGARSYAIYVVHVPMKFALLWWLGRQVPIPMKLQVVYGWTGFVGIVALSFAFAEISWHAMEAPAIRMGARLTKRREGLLVDAPR